VSSETNSTGTGNGGANGAGDFEWTAPLQRFALIVGLSGLGVFAVVGLIDGGKRQFFLSYLVAWVFWLSLPVGSMALIGIHYITGASWGMLWRRLLEASTRTLWLLAVLFIPILASLFIEGASPYDWVRPPAELSDGSAAAAEELQHKFDDWLNKNFFAVRIVIYFGIWFTFCGLINAWSVKGEKNNDARARKRSENISGPMVMSFAIVNIFASTDLVMSLELHWASTMFPLIYSINQLLTCICFCVAMFMFLATKAPVSQVLRPKFQIDMGTILLALTMVWSYMTFSQFMLIWAANLPEEIPFYLKRIRGGWQYVAITLALFHFACPFLLLLFRDVKLHKKRLQAVAIGIMIMCALDVIWWIEPIVARDTLGLFLLMDFGAIAGIGGIWFYLFLNQVKKAPILPTHELHTLPGAEHGH
jgi:hypothetical protein